MLAGLEMTQKIPLTYLIRLTNEMSGKVKRASAELENIQLTAILIDSNESADVIWNK